MFRILKRCILWTALFCVGGSSVRAALFDHSAYDAILQHYVDADGYVDYSGIRDNSASGLDSYIERLGEADLAGWPQDERLAFWINAYNARVLQLIVARPRLKKMSEELELYNKPFKIAGRRLSLNDLLYRILRGRINPDNQQGAIDGLTVSKWDPRIHFALSAGTRGSPRLRSTAYTPENIDRFLTEDASTFVNDPKNVDIKEGVLHLSRLFKLYKRDFKASGGVPAFIISLLDPEVRMDVDTLQGQFELLYPRAVYDYDWTLNDVKNKPAKASLPVQATDESSEPTTSPMKVENSSGTNGLEIPSPSAPMHPSEQDLNR